MRIKHTGKLNANIGKLKPFKIPEDLVLRVDTREQDPLFINSKFEYTGKLIVQVMKLDHGDYSIKGFEDKFAIERKMMSDFYSYIGKERKRTIKKMEKFREIIQSGGFVMLAIECSEAEIMSGNMYSTLSPEVARGAINSFRMRYGVHIYYNKERRMLERAVLDSCIKFYNIMREV